MKKILSLFCIILLSFNISLSTYQRAKADALVIEQGAHALYEGIIWLMTAGGFAFAGEEIYSNRDELSVACDNMFERFQNFALDSFTTSDPMLDNIFASGEDCINHVGDWFQNIREGAVDVVSDAGAWCWDTWKDFSTALINGELAVPDYSVVEINSIDDLLVQTTGLHSSTFYPYSSAGSAYHVQLGDLYAGAYTITNASIDPTLLHTATFLFDDVAIPFVIYCGNNVRVALGETLIGLSNSIHVSSCPYEYLYGYPFNYSFLQVKSQVWSAFGTPLSIYYPASPIPGTEYVFDIAGSYFDYKELFGDSFTKSARDTSFAKMLSAVIFPELAPELAPDIPTVQVPELAPDIPTVQVPELAPDVPYVPESVASAAANSQAWDLVGVGVGNYTDVAADIPISYDGVKDLGWAGVNTIEDAIAYALANDIPLTDVLESTGALIGDKSKDIDYTNSISKGAEVPLSYDTTKDNDFVIPGLDELFPFCIPFDVKRIFDYLDASPKAPKVKWNVPSINSSGKVQNNEIEIDLSKYDDVALTFRTLELIAFILGLLLVTRSHLIHS